MGDSSRFSWIFVYFPQFYGPTIKRALEVQGGWVIEEMIKSCLSKPGVLGTNVFAEPCPPKVNALWALSWSRPRLKFVSPGWSVIFSMATVVSLSPIILLIGCCVGCSCCCCPCCSRYGCHNFILSRAERIHGSI